MADITKDSFVMERFGGWNNDEDEDYYQISAAVETWDAIRTAILVVSRGQEAGEPTVEEAKMTLAQLEIRLWKAPNTKRPER
jgi:hypothetical protein